MAISNGIPNTNITSVAVNSEYFIGDEIRLTFSAKTTLFRNQTIDSKTISSLLLDLETQYAVAYGFYALSAKENSEGLSRAEFFDTHEIRIPTFELRGGRYELVTRPQANGYPDWSLGNGQPITESIELFDAVDFEMEYASIFSASVDAGQTLSLEFRVSNAEYRALVDISEYSFNLVLSDDTSIGVNDTLLGTYQLSQFASTSENDTYEITVHVEVPSDLAGGTYTIGLVADPNDDFYEKNEGVNLTLGSVEVFSEIAPPARAGGVSDFDGNGADDILFFNESTGAIGAYQMPFSAWAGIGMAGSGWSPISAGNFAEDETRSADILWYNETLGAVGFHQIENGRIESWNGVTSSGTNWQAVDTGDINGDGIDDVVWFNQKTNAIGYHLILQEGALWREVGRADNGWEIAAVADINRDGNADILWHNSNEGKLGIFQMEAFGTYTWIGLPSITAGAEVIGTGRFSTTEDHLDVLVFNPASRETSYVDIKNLTDPSTIHQVEGLAPGLGWAPEGSADFNADGWTDILWRHDDGRVGYHSLGISDPPEFNPLPSSGPDWDIIL